MLSHTNFYYSFSIRLAKPHFKDEKVFHNKQTIPTQTFLVAFVPQSFTLLPLSMKHVLILASGTAFHSSPVLAGDKSKVTQQMWTRSGTPGKVSFLPAGWKKQLPNNQILDLRKLLSVQKKFIWLMFSSCHIFLRRVC